MNKMLLQEVLARRSPRCSPRLDSKKTSLNSVDTRPNLRALIDDRSRYQRSLCAHAARLTRVLSNGSTSNLAHLFGQLPSRCLKFVTDCIFCRLGSDARPYFRHSRESLLRRSRIESLLLIRPPRNRLGI